MGSQEPEVMELEDPIITHLFYLISHIRQFQNINANTTLTVLLILVLKQMTRTGIYEDTWPR